MPTCCEYIREERRVCDSPRIVVTVRTTEHCAASFCEKHVSSIPKDHPVSLCFRRPSFLVRLLGRILKLKAHPSLLKFYPDPSENGESRITTPDPQMQAGKDGRS